MIGASNSIVLLNVSSPFVMISFSHTLKAQHGLLKKEAQNIFFSVFILGITEKRDLRTPLMYILPLWLMCQDLHITLAFAVFKVDTKN